MECAFLRVGDNEPCHFHNGGHGGRHIKNSCHEV